MPKGIDKHSVPMIGMTWFLVALFICQICYLCVKKVSEEYNISMWILVIALAILAAQLKEKHVWNAFLPYRIHNEKETDI